MSMPIQRQSESFGYFDDGPRFARDRSSTDLPSGLAHLINTSGPRITGGLLNTRQAVNVDGMNPDDHAYYTEAPHGPGGEWVGDEDGYRSPRRKWNPDYGYEPTDDDERRSEGVAEDDASGYNWGPEPRRASRRPFDRIAAHCPECDQPCDVEVEGHGYEEQYQEFPVSDCCSAELDDRHLDGPDPDRDYDSWKDDQILGNDWREGSMRPFDRAAAGRLAACLECGDDVLPRDGDWEHVEGPSDHPAEPDHHDYDNEEYGMGRDPARAMDEFKYRREGRRWYGQYDDLPPLPEDFNIPDSPEGQPDRSPGWLHRQFVSPHKDVWDIPEHELNDRWNKVYDTLGFDSKTRQEWESGRNTGNPSDKWDGGLDGTFGGGVKDYLTRAPMSKDEYARHREHSQNRAKEMVDGLWGAMFPPEEEEGRKAVQGMDTVNKLMDNGWGPEHIKYDEDDQPYAHYQHPSGWNITDHGGTYKEIGHAATPGEAHDVINVSRNVDGQDYHAPFGPADAHNHIEEQLHGDPEETGGTFQHLTQNHPAIRNYKPRQARRVALAPQDPAMAPQVPVGGGFQAGHRVGLDWRDSTVPGTVIANDGQVHIRWDDGQYTSEDPTEVRLL